MKLAKQSFMSYTLNYDYVRVIVMNTEVFDELLLNISNRVKAANYFSLKSSNTEFIKLCNDIGRLVYDNLKDEKDAEMIMDDVCRELQNKYPGVDGFKTSNVVLMKEFYLEYLNNESLSQLTAGLSWDHNLILIQSCINLDEREFYMRMAKNFNWSCDQLNAQIENDTYGKSQGDLSFSDIPVLQENKHKWITEDAYLKEFVGLGAEMLDDKKQIIEKIISKLVNPLQAYSLMGKDYQMADGSLNYDIDLLLYHRGLNAIVLFEIKREEFKPEFAGTMQFYLNLINSKSRLHEEKPTIGIIICIVDQKIQVSYVLKSSTEPIGVSTYSVTAELTGTYLDKLPSRSDLEKIIQ